MTVVAMVYIRYIVLVFEKYGEVWRIHWRLCDCNCRSMMMVVGVLYAAQGGDNDGHGGGDAEEGGAARCGSVMQHQV